MLTESNIVIKEGVYASCFKCSRYFKINKCAVIDYSRVLISVLSVDDSKPRFVARLRKVGKIGHTVAPWCASVWINKM